MSGSRFPEYAIKHQDTARKIRLSMALYLRQVTDEIEAELCWDPDRYPERLSPGSRDGKTTIYRHPSPDLQVLFEVDRDAKVIYVLHYFPATASPQATVFISYSHQDKSWLAEMRRFLTVLEQQGLIRFWDDSQLVPGVPWEKQIQEVLDGAKAGLLLVSQDFLNSQFVKDVELPKLLRAAEEQGKKIYWVPLRPSTVFASHKEITAYQSLLANPKVSLAQMEKVKREQAFVDISKKLKEHAGLS